MNDRGMLSRTRGLLSELWKVSVHPVTFVVLSIAWCLDLAVGSIAAYFNDPRFWQKMDASSLSVWLSETAPATFPLSLWVYILVLLSFLMVLSLLLCTLNWFVKRRKRVSQMGEFFVHLGFLLIFAGFVSGSMFGHRSSVILEEGKLTPVRKPGIKLKLENLDIVKSPGGRPLDTVSTLVLFRDNREMVRRKIRTNHPLIKGSLVIYPPDDYEIGITGGVVGTSTSGAVTVRVGRKTPLGDGRSLSIGGALKEGQYSGRSTGPGILLVMYREDGTVAASAYLSNAPGMRNRAVLDGVRVALGQLYDTARGVYRIHFDPGVWLVIIGSVILALGTLWALAGFMGIIKDPESSTRHGARS